MRDNTRTSLDRGPKGIDERVLTVEAARFAVEISNVHDGSNTERLQGDRPAHTAGVFLVGRFEPRPGSQPFTSPLFDGDSKWALARLSPLRTVDDEGTVDLHGISLRLWTSGNDADITDLMGLNTQPFMFRTADDFTQIVSLLRSTSKDKLIGLAEFAAATLAGDASVHGLANAVVAAMRGNRSLLGNTYWGIHTYFADRVDPRRRNELVRVPYRFRLDLHGDGIAEDRASKGRILAKYRDLVTRVRQTGPVVIDVFFMLPWRWKRLTDWPDVPERTRQDLINPQAVWKNTTEVHMGRVVLDTVLDGEAAWRGRTDPDCDGLLFDPTRLTNGLHISEDPMLIALSSIYAESHMRRTSP